MFSRWWSGRRPFPLVIAVALVAAAPLLAVSVSGPEDEPAPGTREMAALLTARAAAVDRQRLWFNVNTERVELLRQRLADRRTPVESVRFGHLFARELAFAGQYPEALFQLDRLIREADEVGADLGADGYINLLMSQATTFLRMGEEQNCADGHNRDSCLLPIRGKGVHAKRDGSTRALAVLERILRIDPGNLRARWLVNIAHMTLGSYPDEVPPAVLMPPKLFASTRAMTPFPNVASEVALDIYGLSGGAIVEDLNADGLLDLVISAIGFRDQMRVFANVGGRFVDKTPSSGLVGETGGLNMVHADFDNDGLPDILVLRGGWMEKDGIFPMSLLRNLGNFHFVDVTKAAGLLGSAPTQTATWLDYNGDGWLDLYAGYESTIDDRHPCELFRNNKDGTFTNVARETGVDLLGYVKGVVSGDYDNDGRPDLFLSIAEARNVLFHNDGPTANGGWRFSNVSAKAGIEAPIKSFPTAFFDYDNDGWLDLFVGPFQSGAEDVAADYLGLETKADRMRLYHNERNGTFSDVTKAVGLWRVTPSMGLNYGDLDNDGWLDLYVGTGNPDFATLVPNLMFRNDGGRRFEDVTASGNFGHLQKGHGIAWGDLDNDGDLDIFEKMGGAYESDRAYSALYENPGTPHAWVNLELEGAAANRGAIGARITLVARTAKGSRQIVRTVSTGGSFGSSTLRQHIGLGDATGIASVEIRWPGSGRVQLVRGLELRRHYRVREGRMAPIILERPPTPLVRVAAPPHSHPQ
jgi:hypothetical protein